MILHELFGSEDHPAYQDMSIDNLNRQYDFLSSLINTAVAVNMPMISTSIIQSLNVHAISCLHVSAGQYRPCPVTVGSHKPPEHYLIPELMNSFVNEVNYKWKETDPIYLSAYVLWKLNYIHPFINGNGRTARALCYFIICCKLGGLLKGRTILPELIRQNREEYVVCLQKADSKTRSGDENALSELHDFIKKMLGLQLDSISSDTD